MSCEHTDGDDQEEPSRVHVAQKECCEHHERCEENDNPNDDGGCDDKPETNEDCPYDQTSQQLVQVLQSIVEDIVRVRGWHI